MIAAKEKCPYCEGENYHEMIRTDGTEVISIKKSKLGILPEFVQAEINYCPMCGRDLFTY